MNYYIAHLSGQNESLSLDQRRRDLGGEGGEDGGVALRVALEQLEAG